MRSGQVVAKPSLYWLVAIIALVPAIVKLLCYPGNIGSDDAYIHLQIAHNFVNGLGWGINPHEPVSLSTSPAFTLILAAVETVTPDHLVIVTQILSGGAVVAGLALIFFAVLTDTGSLGAAFLAEAAAAFSVNLWRWNGSLMEATFAFAVVALTIFLFRGQASNRPVRLIGSGVVLGIGLLLRPEMGMVLVLALAVQWMRTEGASRFVSVGLVLLGTFAIVAPWCVFAVSHLGSVIPTTFAAKSTQLHLVNLAILKQMGETLAESLLFPTLLILILLVAARSKEPNSASGRKALAYIIPVGWLVGLIGFYYLKTPELQSPGRYVLPLLPAAAVVIAFLWSGLEARLSEAQKVMTVVLMGSHAVFAIALNFKLVAPVLQRFESQYAATMRAAADELAKRTEGSPNHRVLVEVDIGVLSYQGRGRFEIFDGGALATPSLRGLNIRDQIAQVNPAFVVDSLAQTPEGMGPEYSDLLAPVWVRQFLRHGVGGSNPYFYTILFERKEPVERPKN